MPNNILFIFEGEKAEKAITDSLSNYFLIENIVITCAYCTSIYKMYTEIELDSDLDTFNLVKELEKNKASLSNYTRKDFAEIYMFFDYDGHASNASDQKLQELLSFFREETDKGKLYISYPMVEALKHIENLSSFNTLKSYFQDFSTYKRQVSESCLPYLKHFHLYDFTTWVQCITEHLKKANEIVNNKYTLPAEHISQINLFDNQLLKFINIDKSVAVCSAFPLFLLDYYGLIELKTRLKLRL